MRGQFFEKIKSGKKLKVGGKFVSTHRDFPAQQGMPAEWHAKAIGILRSIAEAEEAEPTPAGEQKTIDVPGQKDAVTLGKWVGRSDIGEREVVFGAAIDNRVYMFVEGKEFFIIHRDQAYKSEIHDLDLLESFMKSGTRTANKYKGSKISRNPATGATEQELWAQGKTAIVGMDEAGRGAWAGPIVSAAVCLTKESSIPEVQDSKALSKEDREKLEAQIKVSAAYGIGEVSAEEIDKIGIDAANRLSFERAEAALLNSLSVDACKPDHVVIDGNPIPADKIHLSCPHTCITQGEKSCKAVAAASILAKTHRDRILEGYAAEYPGYGFEEHKGYGTPQHQKRLKEMGVCECHRKSYAPIKKLLPLQPCPGELDLGFDSAI